MAAAAATTTVVVGAVQSNLLAMIQLIEQRRSLAGPRPRLSRLHAPYTKRRFIFEELSDEACEFHCR